MNRFILRLALVAALASPAVAETTAPVADHVVLGWEEFIKLWTQSQTPRPDPDKPPVDVAINRAEYTGVVKKGSSEFVATFEISVLAEDKWVRIPFLPATAGLKEARLDGQPVPVVTDGGTHALLIKGSGRRVLRVVFSIANGARDGDAQFHFDTAETPITLVSLSFAQSDLDVTVNPAQAIAIKSENGGTVAQAILPPTRRVSVSWRKKQPAAQELPAKVYARFQQLLSIDEAVMRIRLNAGYTLLNAGVNALRLRVPEGVSVLGVNGEGVQGWNVEKGVLTIGFDRRAKGERSLTIQAERPLSGDATLAAPLFFAEDVVRQETAVAIEASGNVEVALGEATGFRQVDVKELPAELWGAARTPLLFGFTGTQTKGAVAFTVTRHEDIPVLTSTVDSANAVTVLTKDGQSVTRVAFYVRNHLKQFLTMSVAPDSEVWSAFVNGRAVKPSKNGSGEILIPLDKSTLGAGDAAFPVEVILYRRTEAIGLAGRSEPSLPKIDLPISQFLWSVYAPVDLRVARVGGTMEADRTGFLPVMASQDAYELREESKRDRGDMLSKMAAKVRGAVGVAMAPQVAERQAAMELDAAGASDSVGLQNHVLPIAFRIPETGRIYRFGKIMVNREVPSVKLAYVREAAVSFAKAVLFAALALALFLNRRRFTPLLLRAASFGQKAIGHLRPVKPREATQ